MARGKPSSEPQGSGKSSADLERELTRLTGELERLEGELSTAREEKERVAGENADLLAAANGFDERIARLRGELDEAKRAITALLNDRREFMGKFEQLRA